MKLPGRETPYQEQDDGWEASGFWGRLQGEGCVGGDQGRSDDGPTGEPGVHTSQVTAWKKRLMAQVAELFVDGRQRRGERATDEQALCEQIGCLKMDVEWLKKELPRSAEVRRQFTSRLEKRGVAISMDGRGRALDNVFVERLWRIPS